MQKVLFEVREKFSWDGFDNYGIGDIPTINVCCVALLYVPMPLGKLVSVFSFRSLLKVASVFGHKAHKEDRKATKLSLTIQYFT